MKIASQCRHVSSKPPLGGVTLPRSLNPRPGRDFPCECDLYKVVFMGVKDGDVYRDYRDVDYGGRRP